MEAAGSNCCNPAPRPLPDAPLCSVGRHCIATQTRQSLIVMLRMLILVGVAVLTSAFATVPPPKQKFSSTQGETAPSLSDGSSVLVQALAWGIVAADKASAPMSALLSAAGTGVLAGVDAFTANRKNATIVDVTDSTAGATLRTKSKSKVVSLQLSDEAKRTKDLLLRGPHSPLYEYDDYGI